MFPVRKRLTVVLLVVGLSAASMGTALADESEDVGAEPSSKHVAAVALALELTEEAAEELLEDAAAMGVPVSQVLRLHALSVVTGGDFDELLARVATEDVGYGDLKQTLSDEELMELKMWKKSLGHFKRQVVGKGNAFGHLDAMAKAEAKALGKAAKDEAKADWKAAKDEARADWKAAKDEARADWKAAKDEARADWKAAKDEAKAAKKGSGDHADG